MTTLIPLILFAFDPEPASQPSRLHLDVATVDGRSLSCTLREIDSKKGLIYDADLENLILPRDEIERISPATSTPTTPAASHADRAALPHVLYFRDGGRLHVSMLSADASAPGRLRVRSTVADTMSMPLTALSAIRFAAHPITAVEQTFLMRLVEKKRNNDLMIVARDDKPIVLPGALESVSSDGWAFRFGQRLQKSPLDAAYGVVLGGVCPADSPQDELRLVSGDVLKGSIVRADSRNIQLDNASAGLWSIPWSAVQSAALANPRIVYLSELEPAAVDRRFFVDADWSVERDKSVTRKPIRIAGRSYARGIGVHAKTVIRYNLEGRYERFCAEVGIDDEAAPRGSVIFRVRADDRTLFESPVLRGGDKPEMVAVDVTGAGTITLEADVADGLDIGDHADWAGARLIRARRSGIH